MQNKEYLNDPSIRQSSLQHILKGADEFKWQLDHPKPPTPEQILGTAVHLLVLQPQLAHLLIKKPDIEPRTRKDKIFKFLLAGKKNDFFRITQKLGKKQEENVFYEISEEEYDFILQTNSAYAPLFKAPENYLLLSQDDYDKSHKMSEAVQRNGCASDLIMGAEKLEYPIYYEYNKIPFKAQLDVIGLNYLMDLKTTSAENDDTAIYHHIIRFLLHFQAASYLQANPADNFYFTFVRSEEPHTVFTIKLSDKLISQGKALLDKACDYYNYCLKNNPEFKNDNTIRII